MKFFKYFMCLHNLEIGETPYLKLSEFQRLLSYFINFWVNGETQNLYDNKFKFIYAKLWKKQNIYFPDDKSCCVAEVHSPRLMEKKQPILRLSRVQMASRVHPVSLEEESRRSSAFFPVKSKQQNCFRGKRKRGKNEGLPLILLKISDTVEPISLNLSLNLVLNFKAK